MEQVRLKCIDYIRNTTATTRTTICIHSHHLLDGNLCDAISDALDENNNISCVPFWWRTKSLACSVERAHWLFPSFWRWDPLRGLVMGWKSDVHCLVMSLVSHLVLSKCLSFIAATDFAIQSTKAEPNWSHGGNCKPCNAFCGDKFPSLALFCSLAHSFALSRSLSLSRSLANTQIIGRELCDARTLSFA